MDIEKEIEKSIQEYDLIRKGEKVIVALSGGKDSVVVLYVLKKLGYNPEALMIDLKIGQQSESHKKNMETFCNIYNIPITFIDFEKELGCNLGKIDEFLKKKNIPRCTLCGVSKRWLLNKFAKEMRADKLVTGHNLDDETQNVLMNFLKGNIFLGINSSPISEDVGKGFVRKIKPLFFIPEEEIKRYSVEKDFKIIYDPCPYATDTYRIRVRQWMDSLTNKQKLDIVNNFQILIPSLKKKQGSLVKICKVCGEPASGEICKFCEMMDALVKS